MNHTDREILKEKRFVTIETEFRLLKKIVPAFAGLILFCIAVFFGITINNINSKVDDVIEQSSLKRLATRGQGLVDSMRVDKIRTQVLRDSMDLLYAELAEMREFYQSGKRNIYLIDVINKQLIAPPFGSIDEWELVIIPTLIRGTDPLREIRSTAVAKETGNLWVVGLNAITEDEENVEIFGKGILVRTKN